MIARLLPVLIAVAALAAPARAIAPAALNEARGVAGDPANFDGARPRADGAAVRAGASTDTRTAEEIAREEQARADARARSTHSARVTGPDAEVVPPAPSEWNKRTHILSGVKGALLGLVIGSLWGLTGLGIGALIGGLLGYGLSRYEAAKAAKAS